MTAAAAAIEMHMEQVLASFALHALWQVPLLAGATWCAVRWGRPNVRLAYALWVCTLLLCVAFPAASTASGYRAAVALQREAGVTLSFEPAADAAGLPALRREPAWQRILHRHLSLRDGVRPFAMALPERVARTIAWAYLAIFACFAVQLGRSWRRTRILIRRASSSQLPSRARQALRTHARQIGLAVPSAGVTEECAGPALAGVLRPMLLLPAAAVATMSAMELDAVLAHELAHLRRNDPLLHAVCSLLLLPVCFHPAAAWTARRIRQTREIACDAEAAGYLGSRTDYAWALLQVAERSGPAKDRGVVGMFLTGLYSYGLFGTGLELFTRGGAMEERMHVLMQGNEGQGRRGVAARWAACVSLGGVALLAASMVQVQPALAGERAQSTGTVVSSPQPAQQRAQDDASPRLIGGEHAREQLRAARRSLAKAGAAATTDDDRRKIATATDVLLTAERELAAASGPSRSTIEVNPQPGLTELQVLPGKLQPLDTGAFRAQMDAFRTLMEAQRTEIGKQVQMRLDSAEFRATLEAQRRQAEKLRAQIDTPEFRAKLEQAKRVQADKLQAQVQSALREHEVSIKRMQAQAAEASALIAWNEAMSVPVPVIVPPIAVDQSRPRPVDSKVMAGNVLSKVTPVYPPEAKEKKIQGEVILHAIINESGAVEALSVVSSPDRSLSESALTAVHQWVYRPYLLNGDPTPVDTTITVHYSLVQ